MKFKCDGDCVRPIDVSVRVMYLILMCTVVYSNISVVLLSVLLFLDGDVPVNSSLYQECIPMPLSKCIVFYYIIILVQGEHRICLYWP